MARKRRVTVREVIEKLSHKDWDAEIRVDGGRGDVEISEYAVEGKSIVSICGK